MAINIKQKAFLDVYIITMNATESYLKVYKNVKKKETARANASRLLNSQECKEYLEERMKILDEELIADQREILRGLTRQFRRQETDYQVVITKKPAFNDEGEFICIEERAEVVEIPTQNRDAIKAAELLGKRFGMWTDKVDMTVDLPTIISGDDELED